VSEFTGERVIPGQVNDDLWTEHVARYAFAARFAAGKRVLDAGCGTGYGSAELARAGGNVIGIDVAAEALHDTRRYCVCTQASVGAMPFRAGSFDLVVAFEVIEHLRDWREFLCDSRRVLADTGTMIVSTPNREYYTESRGSEGANPYHVHEFEFTEFKNVLREFFPYVQILVQNRVESFVFHAMGAVADASVGSGGRPEEAHFFIGVCGVTALPEIRNYVYVPRTANLLRERERHIRKLEVDLDKLIRDHSELQSKHEDLLGHLEEKNRWALELEANWRAAQERVVQLQDELKELHETADRRIAELDAENRASVEWALEIESRLAERAEQLAATVRLLDTAEATVVERTEWAQRLDKELAELRAQLATVRESRWLKLGRGVGVGPKL
jgi:SAM-dependent methyltransferase